MKVKLHQTRRSKWHSSLVSLYGISTNTLSLILIHAKENIEKEHAGSEVVKSVNQNLLEKINKIDSFINDEGQVPGAELEITDY